MGRWGGKRGRLRRLHEKELTPSAKKKGKGADVPIWWARRRVLAEGGGGKITGRESHVGGGGGGWAYDLIKEVWYENSMLKKGEKEKLKRGVYL